VCLGATPQAGLGPHRWLGGVADQGLGYPPRNFAEVSWWHGLSLFHLVARLSSSVSSERGLIGTL